MHVVLVEPMIAGNTGNIIRLCANTGSTLHLVGPLGFELDDARLRRAGLDYHEYAHITVSDSLEELDVLAPAATAGSNWAFTAHAERWYSEVRYGPDDVLMFGCERSGLSAEQLGLVPEHRRLALPMQPDNRSLNLANAVSVVVYEAWRQQGFAGATPAAPRHSLRETTQDP